MEINGQQFGTGWVPSSVEQVRDGQRLSAQIPRVIDYSVRTRASLASRQIPIMNQHQTMSCVSHAIARYGAILELTEHQKREDYSPRYIYSQTFLPQGGSYIYQGMQIPTAQGFALLSSVPSADYNEQTMRDKSLNATAKLEARSDQYAHFAHNGNIDYAAQIIEDYDGFVSGFNLDNNSFSMDGTYQGVGTGVEGHCVYFEDRVIRDHLDHNGVLLHKNEKMLEFDNEWSPVWSTSGRGYFPECQLASLFECYVYALLEDLDPMSIPVVLARDTSGSSKVYALLETKKIKLWIVNPEILQLGSGDIWQGFDNIITKDLSGYKEGSISINVSL